MLVVGDGDGRKWWKGVVQLRVVVVVAIATMVGVDNWWW